MAASIGKPLVRFSSVGESVANSGFAAIDFESARLRSGEGDVPVQVGVAEWDGTTEVTFERGWMSHLCPPGPVYPGIGLPSEARLAETPTLLSLWPQLKNSLSGKILVAHGAGTEKRFLLAFPGHGFGPWIDTLRLTRAVYPQLPSHALGDICRELGLEEKILSANSGTTWHDALFDAVASLFLLQHILKTTGMSPAEPESLYKPQLKNYFQNRSKT